MFALRKDVLDIGRRPANILTRACHDDDGELDGEGPTENEALDCIGIRSTLEYRGSW
jgi:hypothetical protein